MLLQIGKFSKLTGLSIRTLRYYDEIDLFKPTEIDLFTGYRYYTEDQIKDLELINKLKNVGFSLDEIKNNWNNFSDNLMLKKKEELEKKLEDISQSIREIDYLRSHIADGKIVEKIPDKKGKIKSLY